MYKIDDITKLDLSNKKQYGIAKETLDRYELTQSEKKGLLEGIKNKGNGESDDEEYRYFVIPNDLRGLELSFMADEVIGSQRHWPGEFPYYLNMYKSSSLQATIVSDSGNPIVYASAVKINMNKIIIAADPETHLPTTMKVSDYFLLLPEESIKSIEITKEEYEGNVKIPKHLIYTTSDVTLVNESDKAKEAEKLFNALKEIHNNGLDINNYFYYIINGNGLIRINKISNINDEYIEFNGDGLNYIVNIETKRIESDAA